MTPEPQDIIGIVKELQQRYGEMEEEEIEHVTNEVMALFPDLSQALLDRDAKLQIAMEGLEKVAATEPTGEDLEKEGIDESNTDDWYELGCFKTERWISKIAKEALSRIRSLPTQ